MHDMCLILLQFGLKHPLTIRSTRIRGDLDWQASAAVVGMYSSLLCRTGLEAPEESRMV